MSALPVPRARLPRPGRRRRPALLLASLLSLSAPIGARPATADPPRHYTSGPEHLVAPAQWAATVWPHEFDVAVDANGDAWAVEATSGGVLLHHVPIGSPGQRVLAAPRPEAQVGRALKVLISRNARYVLAGWERTDTPSVGQELLVRHDAFDGYRGQVLPNANGQGGFYSTTPRAILDDGTAFGGEQYQWCRASGIDVRCSGLPPQYAEALAPDGDGAGPLRVWKAPAWDLPELQAWERGERLEGPHGALAGGFLAAVNGFAPSGRYLAGKRPRFTAYGYVDQAVWWDTTGQMHEAGQGEFHGVTDNGLFWGQGSLGNMVYHPRLGPAPVPLCGWLQAVAGVDVEHCDTRKVRMLTKGGRLFVWLGRRAMWPTDDRLHLVVLDDPLAAHEPACPVEVVPDRLEIAGGAWTGALDVTAPAGCRWTAEIEDGSSSTLRVLDPAGTGPGRVRLAVAYNDWEYSLRWQLLVGGRAVHLLQRDRTTAGCSVTLSGWQMTMPASGGFSRVGVAATAPGCRWTASVDVDWVRLQETSGSGLATDLPFEVLPNVEAGPRSGTIGVGNLSFVVSQAGGGTAPMRRYLAEGVTSDFLDTELAILNPSTAVPALVRLRFLTDRSGVITREFEIAPGARFTVTPASIGITHVAFSIVVESNVEVIVDRTVRWGEGGRLTGSHSETGLAQASRTWYFTEGSTAAWAGGDFDLFYLLQNPLDRPVPVKITFLRPSPQPPVERTYVLPAESRFNVWVDHEGPDLASTDVSAVIEAEAPIFAERAMYLSRAGEVFTAGHDAAGLPAPATSWMLAEGATGVYFDLFLLLANPADVPVTVDASFLRPDGVVVTRQFTLAPSSRQTVFVDHLDPLLADTAVSTTLTSADGRPFLAERAMWWPGTDTTWYEAHDSVGVQAGATLWALAEGHEGGPHNTTTYYLVQNVSDQAGTATVTVHYEDGRTEQQAVHLLPHSRTNVPMRDMFPNAMGQRFGVVVRSHGEPAPLIVVERAMYSDGFSTGNSPIPWAAGTAALGQPLLDSALVVDIAPEHVGEFPARWILSRANGTVTGDDYGRASVNFTGQDGIGWTVVLEPWDRLQPGSYESPQVLGDGRRHCALRVFGGARPSYSACVGRYVVHALERDAKGIVVKFDADFEFQLWDQAGPFVRVDGRGSVRYVR